LRTSARNGTAGGAAERPGGSSSRRARYSGGTSASRVSRVPLISMSNRSVTVPPSILPWVR